MFLFINMFNIYFYINFFFSFDFFIVGVIVNLRKNEFNNFKKGVELIVFWFIFRF